MKYVSGLLILSAIGFSAGTSSAQLGVPVSGAHKVVLNDKVNKNQFVWISEAPLENTKGSSEGVTGELTVDPKNLLNLRGTVTTSVKTMRTGNATRDNHLMSHEWLDAAKYPTISFGITSVSNVKTTGNAATGLAVGNFTMHGVTKQVTIPFKLTYMPENEKTRVRASGDLVMISADFDIALKDFNVLGTDGVVGSKVGQNIKITAQLFGNTGNDVGMN